MVNYLRHTILTATLFFLLIVNLTTPALLNAQQEISIRGLGRLDAVIIAGPDGTILYDYQSGLKLIPASTLKYLTSLAAIHYLGPGYQFKTEFFMDADNNLYVKGFGDPLLISEILTDISEQLSGKIKSFNDLILDDSYFEKPISIPGRSSSTNPYDAPVGALCSNFNTVFFKYDNARPQSAEPQTPLLPFVINKINATKPPQGRITFSHENDDILTYTGELLKYFLEKKGIKGFGKIKTGKVSDNAKPVLTYTSPYKLTEVISKLMEFSNNFIANQLTIAIGAEVYGKPGTLEKGVQAVTEYAANNLKIENFTYAEGSGISRRNRITAEGMLRLLDEFEPYHQLLKKKQDDYFKTGTLSGISTKAGYIKSGDQLYKYVVMLNSKGKPAKPFMLQVTRSIRQISNLNN
ncbi:MAG: D-alanyl-D-alanine carboxypeptidase [Desulfobacterales bacterium]|nr:D-alanyl-D-alanine carboxypeptidase [Desulfobacterales bacterium]